MGMLFAVVLVLVTAQAEAQIVRVTSTSEGQQVCRVVNGRRERETVRTVEYGTGVIVGRDRAFDYVLTAKHVLSYGRAEVHGKPAEVVAKHDSEDLAILRTAPTTYDVATIGDDGPDGLAVYLDGLGPDSGKSDAKGYRRGRGQILSAGIVSSPSRQGDSGGAIAIGSRLYGIITATSETQTVFVPVSICRPFCARWGVPCRPPASGRVAPLPVPPPRDIPDRQKVQRIEHLEAELVALKKRLDNFKPDHSADVSKKVDRLAGGIEKLTQTITVVESRLRKVEGRPETPVVDIAALEGRLEYLKRQAERPVEVWIETIEGKTVAKRSYPRGSPIRLRFHEKLLTGEGGKK